MGDFVLKTLVVFAPAIQCNLLQHVSQKICFRCTCEGLMTLSRYYVAECRVAFESSACLSGWPMVGGATLEVVENDPGGQLHMTSVVILR